LPHKQWHYSAVRRKSEVPSIYDLKPRFQSLLRPVVARLARAGATPNQITVAAVLLSAAVGVSIALAPEAPAVLLALPGALFLRMALNAVDGMLAREHGMQSRLGQILNEIGDVVSDAALYLPLALVPAFDPRLIVGIVVLAGIGEMTGVVTQAMGSSRRYDGPFGKSDRACVFGALGLVVGLGLAPAFWTDLVLGVALVLGAVTIVNRARRGLAECEAG
jgi:CDP-diacylglycerol--glycerol-3-phosphate 3-phosphatidyltransferase